MTVLASHMVRVRQAPAFLHRLMAELADGGTMSLEGDMSRCRFPDALVVARDDHGVLSRATMWPTLDFVVVRLTPESIEPIFAQVLVAGFKRAIIHVQIERGGARQLGAYDNFHRECVITGPGVSATLLSELQERGVIDSFEVCREGGVASPGD